MMRYFQERLHRESPLLSKAFFALLLITTALFFLCVEYIGLKQPVMRWLPIPICAFVLWTLLRGDYFRNPAYALGFVFLLWYTASRFLNGDTSLRASRYYFWEMLIIYGFAFLFARESGDAQSRRFLKIFLSALVLFFAFFAVIGVIVSLTRTEILLPGGVYPTFFDESVSRIYILAQGPNETAAWATFGVLFTIYLLLEYNRPILLVPGVLLIILFYWILTLANTQGARIGMTVAAIPMAVVLFRRFIPEKKTGLLILVAALSVVLTWYAVSITGGILGSVDRLLHAEETATETVKEDSQETESLIYEERESIKNNLALSGRVGMWETVLSWLETHTKNQVIGTLEARIMTILSPGGTYYGYLHSTWLQTLCVAGIPGLLIILALCVFLLIYAFRILFSPYMTAAEKTVPILILPVAVHSLIESFLFVTNVPLNFNSTNNLLFFVLAGYTVELGRKAGSMNCVRQGVEKHEDISE